jgi:hypothetical protein
VELHHSTQTRAQVRIRRAAAVPASCRGSRTWIAVPGRGNLPEPRQAKNRVHPDLTTPDPSAVDELVALGATVVGEHEVPGGSHRWTVMRDPEGNEFCVAAKSFTGWA